jgi:hypothetical protein
MSKRLLRQYISFVLESSKDARVPSQLVDSGGSEGEEKDEVEDVKEFSAVGAGAIAGFTAPLGMGASHMGPPKSKKKKR